MPLHFDRRHALATLGSLALGAGGLGSAAAAADGRPLAVAVGGRASHPLRHLPLGVALGLDYFRAEGLDIRLADHGSDAQALLALAQGQADVAAVGFENAVRAALQPSEGLRSLVLQTRTSQWVLAVSVRALPQYRSVQDLRRRRIGIPELGSLGHAMVCRVLVQAGVAPESVEFIVVGDGDRAQAALRSGRVHALCQTDPVLLRSERQGDVRIVADARGVDASQAVFGGPVPGTCLLASDAWIRRRATQAQMLVNGVVHALKWLHTAEPADVIQLVPPSGSLADRSLYFAALARCRGAISPDGTLPEAAPATVLRALAAIEPALAGRKLDPARTHAPELVRQARQKWGV